MIDPRDEPTLVDLLRARAALRPGHVVYTYLVDGDEEERDVALADLDRRARAVAVGLRARGVEPGDRVLLIYDSDLQFVCGFYGCLYAGAIAVPGYPPRVNKGATDQNLVRLLAVARDCEPAAMLTSRSVLDRIGHALPELPGFGDLTVLPSDAMEEGAEGDPDGWTRPDVGRGTLAFLQYTSGSTGDPKGAMLTHGNLLANLRHVERGSRAAGATTVGWLPMHHDMGLIGNVLSSLYNGGRLVFMSPGHFLQRPMRWLRAVHRHRGNVIYGPDFSYRMLVRAARPEDVAALDLTCLRTVGNGAEPVRADTLEAFTRTFAPAGFRPERHYPAYGMAEASVLVCMWHPGDPPTVLHVDAAELERDRVVEVDPAREGARPLVGCGVPDDDVDVAVVDPATGERVGPDGVGEIWLAGPNMASGYWRKPEVNAEAFGARTSDGAGPYYRTGDLGFVRGGMVYVTGRLKDLIIIDGRNHYPQDVERTVEEAHASLRPGGVAAFAVEQDGIERLAVVAEVDRRARDVDVDAVARAIRGAVSVAHEIAPREVVLLRAGGLPKTSSGKVRRRACRALLRQGELQVVGHVVFEEG